MPESTRSPKRRARWLVLAAVLVALGVGVGVTLFAGDSSSTEVIEDATGRLSVRVPAGWSDIAVAPLQRGGDQYPYVLAAPDLEAYRTTADAPGAEVLEIEGPGRGDVSRLLEETAARLDAESACGGFSQRPYSQRGFEGEVAVYTECGERGAELWLYALAGPNDDVVFVVGVRGADADRRGRLIDSVTQPD